MINNLKDYVNKYLYRELKVIQTSHRATENIELNLFEKAIIYKYSEDGFEELNSLLRGGNKINEFGTYLTDALDKLPNYNLLCYRATKISNLDKYYDALRKGTTITEKSFLSCTKSRLIAFLYSQSPLFIILSKHGKDIEKIAKFGINSGQNEKEILFKPNSKFRVLDIQEDESRFTITLEEV